MTKVHISFSSQDGSQTGELIYSLHSHGIAERWKKIVMASQKLGAWYNQNDIFYGGGFTPVETLASELYERLEEVKNEFVDLTKDPIFADILSSPFELSQKNLNLAHILFERGIYEMMNVRPQGPHPIFSSLYKLNTFIHLIEAENAKIDGFFIDTRLFESLKGNIFAEENHLFSLDRKWGELYLNYCHTGESYLTAFMNSYSEDPVPQTNISGGIILFFQKSHSFHELEKLQEWMNHREGEVVDLKNYPLGYVPLASLDGDWTPETISEFFTKFPVLNRHLNFS